MSKNLQMSLKKQWFEMTKAGIKTEDYREINEYWFKRLFNFYELKKDELTNLVELAKTGRNIEWFGEWELLFLKRFTHNTMTLGYPKSTDTERILRLEHKGIEIREGREEWGAEKGKLYFVIKHGKQLENE